MSVDSVREAFPDIDPDDYSSNPSGNRAFRDVVAARMSRRGLMRGGTIVAAAGFLAGAGVAGTASPAVAHKP